MSAADSVAKVVAEMGQWITGRGGQPPPCVQDWAARLEALDCKHREREGQLHHLATESSKLTAGLNAAEAALLAKTAEYEALVARVVEKVAEWRGDAVKARKRQGRALRRDDFDKAQQEHDLASDTEVFADELERLLPVQESADGT